MAYKELLTNLYSEHNHNHLLSSKEVGWNKLGLVYELEPAGEMPETLTSNHILIVAQGEFVASFYLDGQWHEEHYAQGDVAIVPAGNLFPRVKIDRDVPLIDLFLPPDTLIDAMGANASKVKLRSHFKVKDSLIQQMALALKRELASAREDSRLYAESMATALGAHLLQRYGVENSLLKEYRGGLTSSQLKTVIDYIQEHLDSNLNLDLLANLVNISPHYFASLFKQSTGRTPHQYIINCRLTKAKTLLRQNNLPIAFVCQEVGFKNQSHFTRVFRQHFQITPKSYQKLF